MRDSANISDVGALTPDYMGFIFVPSSPRYVGRSIAPEAAALPSSITRVGVFRDSPLEEVRDLVERNALGGAQLHGAEDDNYVRELREELPDILIIKAIRITSPRDIAAISERSDAPDLYLLDSGDGGTGFAFDWTWLRSYVTEIPFLLAGGISLSNIGEAMEAARQTPALVGFDINSRFETSPGIKNVEEIKQAMTRLMV
jgi:phosphoribosylanthranilate isomerase